MSPDTPRWSTSAVRISFIFSCPALSRRRAERQQRYLAGILDRDRDVALVLHAVAGHPAGTGLAALADVGAQQCRVLVVDGLPLLGAEHALARLDWLFGRGAPLGGLGHVSISFWVLLIESCLSEGRFVVAAGERARRRGAAPRVVLLGFRAAAARTAAAESAATPTATA